jgi:small subunit ribosomal protein S21
MAEVKIGDKDNFEKAMRVFKRQCQKEGFLYECKERRYYSKPSEKRRRRIGKR